MSNAMDIRWPNISCSWINISRYLIKLFLSKYYRQWYQHCTVDSWLQIYFIPSLLTLLLYHFAEKFSSNIPFSVINRIAAVARLSGLRTNFKSSWNTQMLDSTGLLYRFYKLETVKWWTLLKNNLLSLSFLKILFCDTGSFIQSPKMFSSLQHWDKIKESSRTRKTGQKLFELRELDF